MRSAFYKGIVTHRRLRPKAHLLKYSIFYLLLDLDECDLVNKKSIFLTIGGLNLLSFSEADFGDETRNGLKGYICQLVDDELGIENIHAVRLLCIPRHFGFAFNPISTFFCYDKQDCLLATVYEVRNTFGEKIHYVLKAHAADVKKNVIEQSCRKKMYVSPFIGMDCRYDFKIASPSEKAILSIQQLENNQPVLNASFVGRRKAISQLSVLQQLILFPINSFLVVVGIHYEALKLWMKRVPLVKRITKVQFEAQAKGQTETLGDIYE